MVDARPDVAYVYPAPFWGWKESGWVKSLLLFFDQVAILLPGYMYGQHIMADPTLVIPLEERGLLRVLEPSNWVDQEMTEQLAGVMVELLTDGVFDDLPEENYFQPLSNSRLGHSTDVELADMLVEELAIRDLARPSEDSVFVLLHPTVRTTVLVILAQLSRSAGSRRNLAIHPATNSRLEIDNLIETLARDRMPSSGAVINLDLHRVAFDLDPVPLDELLEFREAYGDGYKTYMRDLRRFTVELAWIDDKADREALLRDRLQEIDAAACDLRRTTRRSVGKTLGTFSLGLVGTAWSLARGDILGALLKAGGAIWGLVPDRSRTATAYSYIFDAQRDLGGWNRS